MKRHLSYLLVAMMFVTSCSKLPDGDLPVNPTPNPTPEEVSVSFRPTINPSTRATDIEFERGDKISVFASEYNGIYEDNYAENVEYVYEDGLFTTNDRLTYPDEQSGLAFYAVYPYDIYSAPSFNFYVNTDQSTHEKYTDSDLMTSSNIGYNEEIVHLEFNHRLSKIVINLNQENLPAGSQSLRFKNVYCGAQANLSSNTYNALPNSDRTDIVASSNGTNSFKAILPPQTIEAGEIFAEITIGNKTYSWQVDNNLIFNSGVEYTYTLYFSKDSVKFTSYINPWNTPSDVESVIPEEYITLLEPYITIYKGVTPPNIEGTYLSAPHSLYYDSRGGNYTFADEYLMFYNQSSNNTLNMMATQMLGDLSTADGVFISGSDNNFTIYFNEYTSYDDDSWLTVATIISGTKRGSYIDNFRRAFVVLSDYDPNDRFMDVGDYRVIYDGDYVSEQVDWPLDNTRANTGVEGVSIYAR